jgi:hypothetical protein
MIYKIIRYLEQLLNLLNLLVNQVNVRYVKRLRQRRILCLIDEEPVALDLEAFGKLVIYYNW